MEVESTKLKGVLLIKPVVFQDFRGKFVETYNKAEFNSHGIDIDFVQDDMSFSKKDVLRGIHGDNKTWKLISCRLGKIFYVVVDCDKDSPDFGKWESFGLNDENQWMVLVPPKYGNAHLALSENVIFHYKQSEYYDPNGQFSYRWNDPKFGIEWPIEKPILSKRDEEGNTGQVAK